MAIPLDQKAFSMVMIVYFTVSVLSLDAMDTAGEHHLHIDHNVYKRRLDLMGQPLEEPQKEGTCSNEGATTLTDNNYIENAS